MKKIIPYWFLNLDRDKYGSLFGNNRISSASSRQRMLTGSKRELKGIMGVGLHSPFGVIAS